MKYSHDIIGHKFGDLTVDSFHSTIDGIKVFNCKCSCGSVTQKRFYDLIKGKIKSCGCASGLLSFNQKEELVNRYKAGESTVSLAKEYGISTRTVIHEVNKSGYKKPLIHNEIKDEAIQLYLSGLTLVEVSEKLNVSAHTIGKALKKSGVTRRPDKPRFKVAESEQKEIAEAYELGFQAKDICAAHGINYTVMSHAVRRNGVEKRESHRRKELIKLDESVFKDINRDSLYWAGLLGADGNVCKNTISLYLHKNDEKLLYDFQSFLKTDIKVAEKKKSKCSFLSFTRKEVAEDLVKFGIVPNKSLTYSPPDFCADSPDFWRGAIDGDGSISVVKGTLRLGLCGSFDSMSLFLKWVKNNCETKCSVVKHSSIFRVFLSGANAIKIARLLYADNPRYFMDRKYQAAKPFMDAVHSHI